MSDPNAPSRRHRLGLAAAIGGGVAHLATIVAGLGADERWPIDEKVRATLAARRHPKIRATLKIVGLAGTSPGRPSGRWRSSTSSTDHGR